MGIKDLFVPKWQHSDPTVRAKEVKGMSELNQAVLEKIAQRDSVPEVRKIALRKISNPEVIETVLNNDSDTDVKSLAQTKLNELLMRTVKSSTDESLAKSALAKIKSAKHIEEVAKGGKIAEIRLACIDKVQKTSVLVDIANRDADTDVAKAAAARLDKKANLENVQHYSKHSEVRAFVTEKLKELGKATAGEKADNLDARKREVLISSMEALVLKKDALSLAKDFDSLKSDWNSLSSSAPDAETAKMQAVIEKFDAKLKHETDEVNRVKKEALDLEETENALKSIYEEVEEILNLQKGKEAEAEIKALEEKWAQVIPENMDNSSVNSYQKRFQNAIARFQRQIQLEESAQHDKEKEAEIRKDLIQQLRLLTEQEKTHAVEKQLNGLQRSWSRLKSELSEDDDTQKEFTELSNKIGDSIRNLKEEKQAKEETTRKKLEEIIHRVEELNEDQEFKHISKELRQCNMDWKEAVGEEKFHFQNEWHRFKEAVSRFEEMQKWEFWHNEQGKEKLCEEADKLKDEENIEQLYLKVRQLQKSWKNSGFVSPASAQILRERFQTACNEAFERCKPYLEQMDAERKENFTKKSEICDKIEALIGHIENWNEATHAIHDLQKDWRETGPVPKENLEEIRTRYQKLCDSFFSQKREFLKKEDEHRLTNLTQKTTLCEEAEALKESTDWNATTQKLKDLQEEWKRVGPVPRKVSDEIWGRFRKACDAFFELKREHFNHLDEERKEHLKAKEELCAKLEGLDLSNITDEIVNEFTLAREEWDKIGPVQKAESDAIWDRYCKVCDNFLEKRMETDPELRKQVDQTLVGKGKILEEVKTLIESTDWNKTADRLKELQKEWKDLGRAGNAEHEMWAEFRKYCDEFFNRRRDHFDILEQTRLNNLSKKRVLVEQAERLAEKGPSEEGKAEIRLLRRTWKDIGPVPRKYSDKIWARFNTACDAVFADRQKREEVEA